MSQSRGGKKNVISKLHANLTRELAALLPSAPLGIQLFATTLTEVGSRSTV